MYILYIYTYICIYIVCSVERSNEYLLNKYFNEIKHLHLEPIN